MKSAYDRFWDVFDKRQKVNTIDEPFEVGTIISEKPLIIEVEGLPLGIDDLYINRHLLPWIEYCGGRTTVAGVPAHHHGLVYIDHPSKLVAGCHVALYGTEWSDEGKSYQKYHVMYVLEDKEGIE